MQMATTTGTAPSITPPATDSVEPEPGRTKPNERSVRQSRYFRQIQTSQKVPPAMGKALMIVSGTVNDSSHCGLSWKLPTDSPVATR
jgi:hypothetical protein